jgi:hypothetical protein
MEHLVLVQEIQVVAQQTEKQWASKESAKSKKNNQNVIIIFRWLAKAR